jgi:lipid II:glycine glycyltransferase (peptidoglycan interpeptide bridge formation enzyme)
MLWPSTSGFKKKKKGSRLDRTSWNEIVLSFPSPHFLQTWEWGEIKEKYGWKKDFLIWKDETGQVLAASMLLIRSMSFLRGRLLIRICYTPRGPLFMSLDEATQKKVLDDLQVYARNQKAVFLKIDPEIITSMGLPGEADEATSESAIAFEKELKKRGWIFSNDQIQFRNTVILKLGRSEEELLAAMKQKTRYNIRLAQKKGVQVRIAEPKDFPLLYQMYLETSVRDGFIIREQEYYLDVWNLFHQHDMARAFIAEVEGEAVAGLFLFYVGTQAWYFYGMSTDKYKEKMPNYLLQWEAMRFAKARGCTVYDLWGAPDDFNESDRLWNVFRFKQGLGREAQRSIGAWDFPARKGLYFFYQQVLPRILSINRKRRRKAMSTEMSQNS